MITPSVHPELAAHAARSERRVVRSGHFVYTFQGYNLASVSVIDAPDGLILVDCAAQEDNAREIAADIAKRFDKPIKCVIYTHFHNDHVNGVEAFVTAADVDAEQVEIWSHEKLMGLVTSVSAGLGPIMGKRASYTFGAALPRGEAGFVHAGLGLPHDPGPRGFIAPTHTVAERSTLSLCGMQLELIPIPSETDDMIGVWLPDEKILLSGDCIQGEVYPNLYTLRGTPYRDPMQWVETIDWILADLQPETVVTHHGGPIVGKSEVREVLQAYRDAIQYTHDQTVRYINKGWDASTIAQTLKLPSHLANHHWLGEIYGSLKHCIPAIYAGKIGWFSGDPVDLDPLPRQERASRYIKLMGGQLRVQAEVQKALSAEDYLWAAELAGYLVSIEAQNRDYCRLRAECLRAWAFQQKNANWRNWALSCAMELDPPEQTQAGGGSKQLVVAPPALVREFPAQNILKGMATRLKAEQCEQTTLLLGFHILPARATRQSTNQAEARADRCALEIRKGVCQYHPGISAKVNTTLTFNHDFFTDLVLQKDRWPDAIESGRIQVQGDRSEALTFLSCFEPPPRPAEIKLVSR